MSWLDESIYGLVASDGMIRYVGRTTNHLRNRLSAHLSDSKRRDTPLCQWLAQNRDFIRIIELERVPYKGDAKPSDRERFWIRLLRSQGSSLWNIEPRDKLAREVTIDDIAPLEKAMVEIEAERASA